MEAATLNEVLLIMIIFEIGWNYPEILNFNLLWIVRYLFHAKVQLLIVQQREQCSGLSVQTVEMHQTREVVKGLPVTLLLKRKP